MAHGPWRMAFGIWPQHFGSLSLWQWGVTHVARGMRACRMPHAATWPGTFGLQCHAVPEPKPECHRMSAARAARRCHSESDVA
eukprot:10334524-Alexandrium_andersonii.AAC.1